MTTYPTSPRSAFLAWGNTHHPIFSEETTNIGITPPQATTFANAVAAAAAADQAVSNARTALRTAVEAADTAFTNYRRVAGDTVRIIRTFAENQADPAAVYQLAQIPGPKVPTPVAPPGQPTDVSVALNPSTGAIELRWKASNPAGSSGTAYIVRRRISPTAAFEFIGVTGGAEKRFVDDTFIAGPDSVQYTIQGQRGGLAGAVSAIVTVSFGRAPGGGMTVTGVTEQANVKLAA